MAPTVLVVEDEWLIAEDHAAMLREARHDVVGPCATVKAALSAIDDAAIDVALLDVELRGETSVAIAERLRALDIPFAFVSGQLTYELPPDLRQQPLLSKPLARTTLTAAVERLVKSKG